MLFNSVCNHTRDFVNHSYDYRPKWTSLSPITITYQVNTVLKVQVHACEEKRPQIGDSINEFAGDVKIFALLLQYLLT